MSKGLVTQQYLTDIANAIRNKNSSSTVYKPSEMAQAINNISSGTSVTKGIIINSLDVYGCANDVSLVGMTEIPTRYFYGASYLPSSWMGTIGGNLHLPDNITSIGEGAFYDCANLELTSLPSGITSIGSNAFYGCKKLALTSLPSGITSIGSGTFTNCYNLALTSLPSGITSIGDNAFNYCEKITLTSLPDNLTSIGNYAFYKCTNLALTSLPSGITSIGGYAFNYCENLALTSLPSGVISIPTNCFYRCMSLTEMTLNGDIKSIGSYAFRYCNLTKLVMPNVTNVTTLSSNVFRNTPIADGTGYIYVPDDLVDSFKTATNWSTYANQIKGISELT